MLCVGVDPPRLKNLLDTFWHDFVNMLASVWYHLLFILESFWYHFGGILETSKIVSFWRFPGWRFGTPLNREFPCSGEGDRNDDLNKEFPC